MLQLQYPSFDQAMMVGHGGERSAEHFHRSHSYNPPKSSTPSEPRFSATPSTTKYTTSSSTSATPSSQNAPSLPSSQATAKSSASRLASPSASASDVPDSQDTPPSTIESESKQTPNANPQDPPPNSYNAVVSISAPTTAHSSPSRLRRPSSLHTSSPPIVPIKLRDLSQVIEIGKDAAKPQQTEANASEAPAEARYDISSLPVSDVIEMVAALLTKITTTNDRNHETLQRNMPTPEQTSSLPLQTSSVLAFHGKNVPSISIHSYLSRIHKYCPTTYEVFLSLLVYFDRMTELVNSVPTSGRTSTPASGTQSRPSSRPSAVSTPSSEDVTNMASFVVDSFNIHRLIIAGVTCASKFFSDVFYTNSRYAKVGGLPLPELNHLELQFLLLNDFRLSIPVEELEAYGTMLVHFYAREKMATAQTDKMSE